MYTDCVYPDFVTLLADISCLLFLFRKCLFVVVVLFSLSSLPPYVFFLFSSSFFFFSFFLAYWPIRTCLLACLTRAAILHFSFRRHLFLDRGRVSEGLVRVSLAFHLFVVGTVIFASVLLCQVKSKTSLFLQRKTWMPHIKPQRQCKKMCKRLTLKKYATTRNIAYITIYN